MNSPLLKTYTSKGNLDLDGFTNAVSSLLKRAWGEDWGELVHDEPTGNDPDKVTLPKITYDSNSRVRSKTHKALDPIKFNQFREGNESVELYRMWFDVLVDFKFYHATNREARLLLEEFEDFIFTYKDHFRDLGVSDIIWEEELPPQVVSRFGAKMLPERTLRYLVRIERITELRSKIISDVITDVKSSDGTSSKPQGKTLMENYRELNRKL
ncbi:hypothetical protein ACK8P5_25695 (plasmid) [Paenibacillus sp. EC2-1]|uniref:hypothetical protein n=1 Tax=Paenibacillus sp. EC2-1 TaxID=3388665 RepID=UPI003BEF0356